MRTRTLAVAASLFAAVLYLAVLGQATYANAFLIVDMTDDVKTASACTDAPDDCSLRGAVLHANASSDSDTIIVPAGTYALTLAGADTEGTEGSLRILEGHTTVRGSVTGSTVIDADLIDDGVFAVQSGATAIFLDLTLRNGLGGGAGVENSDSNVTVRNVTMLGGDATGSGGGGIYILGGKTVIDRSTFVKDTADSGGAIFIEGPDADVTIIDSTINANSAGFNGGGIASFGDSPHIYVYTSTISANHANHGGGIYNQSSGNGSSASFFVSRSTVSGNSADTGDSPNGHAMFQNSTLSLDLSSVTVYDNSGDPGTAAVFIAPGSATVFLSRTIFAENDPASCGGGETTTSIGGSNFASDGTCALGVDGVSSTDLMLGPLTDNGGPTLTHIPNPDSPLIDADDLCDPGDTDQRGRFVPVGDACEPGAVEFGLPGDQVTIHWGDVNCLDDITLDDVIWLLASYGQPDDQNVEDECPQAGDYAFVGDYFLSGLWANLDCNGRLDGDDALRVLAFLEQVDVGIDPLGCPDMGSAMLIGG